MTYKITGFVSQAASKTVDLFANLSQTLHMPMKPCQIQALSPDHSFRRPDPRPALAERRIHDITGIQQAFSSFSHLIKV